MMGYIAQHQDAIGGEFPGQLHLNADFGGAVTPPVDNPPVDGPPDDDSAGQHLQWASDNLDLVVADIATARKYTTSVKSRTALDSAKKNVGDVRIELGEVRNRLPKVSDPGNTPPVTPPTPQPPVRTIGPGQSVTLQTLSGNVIRISTPNTPQTALWVVMAFAGTGFQGSQIGMIPAVTDNDDRVAEKYEEALGSHMTRKYVTPDSVQNAFTAAGAIYVECAYRGGAVEAQVADAFAAFDKVHEECDKWGGARDKIAVLGHSSGGFLCGWIALSRPCAVCSIMSGAALRISGYNWPTQSQYLISRAGVTEDKTPGANLGHAVNTMAMRGIVAMQDEQIPPQSELDFYNQARQTGYGVQVLQVPGMHGDSINPGIADLVQWIRAHP